MSFKGAGYLKLVVDNSPEARLQMLQKERIIDLVGQVYRQQDIVELWRLCQEIKIENQEDGYYEFANKFRSAFGHLFENPDNVGDLVRHLELINIFMMLVYLRHLAGEKTLMGIPNVKNSADLDNFESNLDDLDLLIESAVHLLLYSENNSCPAGKQVESDDLRAIIKERVNSV